MASRRLDDLVPPLRVKAKQVVELCRKQGVDLLIYCTLRSLEEQAILYRQSRTSDVVKKKMATLRAGGCGFLADIIKSVGPQSGPKATNAAPGESWHNFGEAFDAVPLLGGKPVWNYNAAPKLWDTYGRCVRKAGLIWAGDWKRFREFPHAQLRAQSNPLATLNPAEARALLKRNGLLN